MEIHIIKKLAWWIRNIIRYEGPHFLLWHLTMKCTRPFGRLRMVNLYQKDLTQPLVQFRPKVYIAIGEATDSDIEQVARILLGDPLDKRVEDETYAYQGQVMHMLKNIRLKRLKCFVGKIGNKVIHYNWIGFNKVRSATETGPFVELKKGQAHLNHAETLTSWRGKGIHTVVQNEMLRYLKESGYHTAYTFVSTTKRSSLKTHQRLGWKRTGVIIYFVPRGKERAYIWCVKGSVGEEFVATCL